MKVFLSHASEDEDVVRKFRDELHKEGIETWLASPDIDPGADWQKGIQEELRKVDYALVFLSESYVSKRGYVQEELKLILEESRRKQEGRIFVIPVRLDGCASPDSLECFHVVDLRSGGGIPIIRLLRGEDPKLELVQVGIDTETPRLNCWEDNRKDAILKSPHANALSTMEGWRAASDYVWPQMKADADALIGKVTVRIAELKSINEQRLPSKWRIMTVHEYLGIAYVHSASLYAAGIGDQEYRAKALLLEPCSSEECTKALHMLDAIEADPECVEPRIPGMRNILLWYAAKAKSIDVYCGGRTTAEQAKEAVGRIQGDPLRENRPDLDPYMKWFFNSPG